MRVVIKYVSMSTVIKTQISKLLRTTPFCNNIDQVAEKIVKNDKSFGVIKPKGLNKIDKFGYGHLCLREKNLSFINN